MESVEESDFNFFEYYLSQIEGIYHKYKGQKKQLIHLYSIQCDNLDSIESEVFKDQ